jgi:hypothetical protein
VVLDDLSVLVGEKSHPDMGGDPQSAIRYPEAMAMWTAESG